MKIKAKKTTKVEKTVVKAAPKAAKKAGRPKSTKKEVTFTIHADAGKAVFVAGEFNSWDPTVQKMAYKARKGIYAATLKLEPGTYQYKYVIDGTWCADPENVNAVANDQGTFNSVVVVQ